MALLDEILARRREHRHYDEELWGFVHRVQGSRIVNLSNEALQVRLGQLERNIQYLDTGYSPRDELPPERGWISPWWWLRLRYWTLLEFQRRGLTPARSTPLAALPALAPAFAVHMNSGAQILVRISQKRWLLDTLREGVLRFAPATSYDDASLNAARADDELSKAYNRPGQQLTVTTLDGKTIPVLGDAVFNTRRQVERGNVSELVPYWLSCFSTELDPRLFDEFPGEDSDEDGCLVIFDVEEFLRRALPALIRSAPLTTKRLLQNNYFDPYHPSSDRLDPIEAKAMVYAYQREARFVLDPEGGEPLGDGGVLFVSIGSIQDIAAVYGKDGRKIDGAGPNSFLA